MRTPLEKLTVLDLTQGPVGGLTTMILGDFGAEVIKIEPPGGDPFRKIPSSPMWLRGKKSVEIDMKTAEDARKIHPLAADADIMVTNQRSEEAESVGLDYGTLSRINPRLIYCQVTGFGDRGPYAKLPPYDAVVSAKGGRMMDLSGITNTPGPVFAAVQVATHATTQNAVSGILAAIIERRKSGKGQMLRTSLLQGLMPYDQGGSLWRQLAERNPRPRTDQEPYPYEWVGNFDYHPVQAGDGKWMQMGNLMPRSYRRYLEVTGLDKVLEEAPYDEPMNTWSPDVRESFREILLRRMQEKTADEWMEIFVDDANVACHPYLTAQEVLDDPDMVENGHVVTLSNTRQLGPLARLTETPAQIKTPPAEPGEHNHLLDSHGVAHAAEIPECTPGTKPPLAGIKVVEFAAIIATPFGISFLADMGARVIKVEPLEGDPFRGQSGEVGSARCNNGKESIAVNLKTEQGKAIAHALIKDADILIHNYRQGVPEKLGIGYEQAKALNPGIVYLQANGYGPNGPGALRPSAAPIPGAALGGAAYQIGGLTNRKLLSIAALRETARKLTRANDVNPDPNTSMVVCSAALLGLCAKARTGKGQQIFLDMFGANAYANYDDFISYEGKPERPPLGWRLRGPHPLYRLYSCKEGWIFLGLLLEDDWVRFCKATDREDLLQHADFATDDLRRANGESLARALSDLFRTKAASEWERLVGSQGLGCVVADGPSTVPFLLQDQHIKENKWMIPATHKRFKNYLRHGPMVEFSRSKCDLRGAVMGGEHTEAILKELGYNESQIQSLTEDKVVSVYAGETAES